MSDAEDSTEKKPAEPEATYNVKPKREPAPIGSVQKNSSNPIALILSVISLAVVIAGGYFAYQTYLSLQTRLNDSEQQTGQYENRIQELQQQVAVLGKGVQAELVNARQRYDADMKGLTDQLLSATERMTELSGTNQRIWHLDEAYYLLRIANNRIIFLKDAPTTISLLKQVDKLLAGMEDPNLFATRKKLTEDIQRINAWPKIDSTGLAIRIGALQSRVDSLPVVQVVQTDELTLAEDQPEPNTWYEHLAQSFRQLGDQWFDVRYHGTGYTPVISQNDEQQLRFAIMLTLQTIQYAILYQDNDLYQASLLQLKSRLTNYFDVRDSQVEMILVEIEELLKLKVAPETINGLTSLPALNTYMKQLAANNQDPEATKQ